MLVRVAYLVFMHKIPKELVLNMDETPLMWLARKGYTWGDKGARNTYTSGHGDKRQATGTPWVNMLGEIAFFHVTIKGKTTRCLPDKEFMAQACFQGGQDGSVKFIFDYSHNHWVTKTTMRTQVQCALRGTC